MGMLPSAALVEEVALLAEEAVVLMVATVRPFRGWGGGWACWSPRGTGGTAHCWPALEAAGMRTTAASVVKGRKVVRSGRSTEAAVEHRFLAAVTSRLLRSMPSPSR